MHGCLENKGSGFVAYILEAINMVISI